LEQASAIEDINQTIDEFSEVYTFKTKVWEATGLLRMGRHPFNSLRGTKRLLARRGDDDVDRPLKSSLRVTTTRSHHRVQGTVTASFIMEPPREYGFARNDGSSPQ